MATPAIAGDTHMIEIGGRPGKRRVAHITILVGWNMVGGFANLCSVVMTTTAVAGYASVVEARGRPGHC